VRQSTAIAVFTIGNVRFMRKPDVLIFLTLVVIVGTAVTSIAAEERREPTVLASESSIR